MKPGARKLGAVLAVVVGLGVAGCGTTKTVTVVQSKTATVVATTTVTDTVTVTHTETRTKTVTAPALTTTVTARPLTTTVTASTPASTGASSAGQGVNTEALSNSFEQALQRAVGTSDTISSGDGQDCSANVNPGSYDCFAIGNGMNQYDYAVTAANGRWTGTVNTANQTNAEPSRLSGTY